MTTTITVILIVAVDVFGDVVVVVVARLTDDRRFDQSSRGCMHIDRMIIGDSAMDRW